MPKDNSNTFKLHVFKLFTKAQVLEHLLNCHYDIAYSFYGRASHQGSALEVVRHSVQGFLTVAAAPRTLSTTVAVAPGANACPRK